MMKVFSRLLNLDRHQNEPVYRQIYQRIKDAIVQGALLPDTRVPSVRALASEVGVARGTVENAYAQLIAEGYLQSRGQGGTYVSPQLIDAPLLPLNSVVESCPPIAVNNALSANRMMALPFQLGLPALDAFPRAQWGRMMAKQLHNMTAASLGHPPVTGLPALRESIAHYLQLSRGFSCQPEQVFICAGYQALLDLVVSTLLKPGDCGWLEDPGYPATEPLIREAGLIPYPVKVDDEGMDVATAIQSCPHARFAIVTPAHQSPLGVALSLVRRMALLDWAEQQQSWIIEDDYDSEFRYQGRPLPPLKSMDRQGRVLYAGTFSKVMFPALRLAYLVVPPALVAIFNHRCQLRTCACPPLIQASVAEFMNQGHFYRHLKRMRHLYAERRERLSVILMRQLAGIVEVERQSGGIQLLARLDSHFVDREIAAEAQRQGLAIQALSDWGLVQRAKRNERENGLLMGFTNLTSEAETDQLVARLAKIIRSVSEG
ncbi:PLP-dependent aminotransferase family protein [Yersinia enterocolitica]|jgi:GntR family transcriptional regulator/MocR family aminotransferase|uniref:PLP-dependent aminotransferase family protein n=1 Tax=Yersinia massiliensis TaxID=419257 RepID=A0ABM6UQI7_9GAMM|nr:MULTISPECIES: PLP-dependent aminotransferase family protein [Yersinia]HEC1651137.1 PLP-dependent aminotransferase family protein [Yersinia enterocolitica]ATM87113.1 PLP-dependent aminotransferase family protein [Yersinia frederiksenii]AVX37087.1 PLP-dependent aminotransferase family protein [Yersinia massiliensis]MCB5319893.1 PLP-dependent aminotransferase family protein [Yersinia massiliensis]QKJ11893.1 PLP-dependent aminotransferase family protein [Yersinia massiliensis]